MRTAHRVLGWLFWRSAWRCQDAALLLFFYPQVCLNCPLDRVRVPIFHHLGNNVVRVVQKRGVMQQADAISMLFVEVGDYRVIYRISPRHVQREIGFVIYLIADPPNRGVNHLERIAEYERKNGFG